MKSLKFSIICFGLSIIIACGQANDTNSAKNVEASPKVEKTAAEETIATAEKVAQTGKVEAEATKVATSNTEESKKAAPTAEPVKVPKKSTKEEPTKKEELPEVRSAEKSEVIIATAPSLPTKANSPASPGKELVKVTAPTTPTVSKEKIVLADKTVAKDSDPPTPTPFSHDTWDELLRQHISSSGKVNYKGFKASQAAFDVYLKSLSDNPVQSSWSRNKKMAYWINAYNAFTIKLIVDNYPLSSITKLHGGKPWDVKWIKLGGKTYSLNNIEHDILRPQFKDARIHFAVNCAAKSCPPILNRAWTESNLNANLEKLAIAFINNPSFNKIAAKEVQLSKIFEWYGEDFGDLIAYLNKYAATKIDAGAKVGYLDYDWALNE